MPRKRELHGYKVHYYPNYTPRCRQAMDRAEWLREESRTTHRVMEGLIALMNGQDPR